MKNPHFYLFIATFVLTSSVAISQTKITATKYNSKIDITINNNFFTSYIFSQDEKYPFFFLSTAPQMPV
jgi:hypothetical protein